MNLICEKYPVAVYVFFELQIRVPERECVPQSNRIPAWDASDRSCHPLMPGGTVL